ncbi:LytTR family transcriptional regulator DNA-binding domain-containing protein [Lutimonas vermicola]|uniref:LytTR family transcriptional regulator DNA-binding domain-containing protein n=1 Tax=Lutimonas vermicola TaxID=414288 RepID=A0ABU9KZ90_9FLAO
MKVKKDYPAIAFDATYIPQEARKPIQNIKNYGSPRSSNTKFVVNIDSITDIISYTNNRLQVKLDHFSELEIIVSRERVKDFRKWLE